MPRWGMQLACAEAVRCPMPMSAETDWFLLVKFAGRTEVDEHAEMASMALIESGFAVDAVIAQSKTQETQLWEIRDSFSEIHRFLGLSFRFDLSVPLGRIPALIGALEPALQRVAPGARAFAFGYLGDGNLHFSACEPPGGNTAAFRAKREAVENAVNEVCWALGGSISAEHGIGQLHRSELAHQKSAAELDLQRRIKAAFDPRDIFNPHKLLP